MAFLLHQRVFFLSSFSHSFAKWSPHSPSAPCKDRLYIEKDWMKRCVINGLNFQQVWLHSDSSLHLESFLIIRFKPVSKVKLLTDKCPCLFLNAHTLYLSFFQNFRQIYFSVTALVNVVLFKGWVCVMWSRSTNKKETYALCKLFCNYGSIKFIE